MGSITLPEYDYGHPKNEDTAYDNARQDKVDADIDGDPYEELLLKENELKQQQDYPPQGDPV